VQRVLVRLQEQGLIVARDRSGVEVLDPTRAGGSALWPLVMANSVHDPDSAVELLSDALAARRLLSMDVLQQVSNLPPASYLPALAAAVADFETAVVAGAEDLATLSATESEIIRILLVATRRTAVLGIFNDVAKMLASNRVVLAAIYAQPSIALSAWKMFLEILTNAGGGESFAFVEPILRAIDDDVVAAFHLLLQSEPK
jgi:DNA-binding FadR family transcriptional regulator